MSARHPRREEARGDGSSRGSRGVDVVSALTTDARPGSTWSSSARTRRARSTRATRRRPRTRSACAGAFTACPRRRRRPSSSRSSPSSTPTRRSTASSSSSRSRRRSTSSAVLDAVDPKKDVDGFHPINAGLLASGRAGAGPVHPGRLHAPPRARAASIPRARARSSSDGATSSASPWRSSSSPRTPR